MDQTHQPSQPQGHPPRPHESGEPSRRASSGVLIAVAAGAFLAVIFVCGGFGAGLLYLMNEDMKRQAVSSGNYVGGPIVDSSSVEYTMTVPPEATVGEPFVVVCDVVNDSNNARTLSSLEIYGVILAAGRVVKVDPEAELTDTFEGSDYAMIPCGIQIPAGGSTTVEVHFQVELPGRYEINIDANFNNEADYFEQYGSVVVVKPAEETTSESSP